jgi:hypothetical protein
MSTISDAFAEREARVERQIKALMERHGAETVSALRGAAKRECERIARDAPNVYLRLMFAERRASDWVPSNAAAAQSYVLR